MTPAILKGIKPEYSDVEYVKSETSYLVGPAAQHLNNSVFEGEEPTRPVNAEQNIAWAREINSSAA